MVKVDKICEMIEDNIEPTPDLYCTAQDANFCSTMNNFFFTVEAFDPHIEEDEENLNLNDVVFGEKTLRLNI
jgi:hypothetical protein